MGHGWQVYVYEANHNNDNDNDNNHHDDDNGADSNVNHAIDVVVHATDDSATNACDDNDDKVGWNGNDVSCLESIVD